MAVKDHPVHPSGVRHGEHRSGCHSKFGPRFVNSGYWANNGWKDTLDPMTGEPVSVMTRGWVVHTMSTKCRQVLSHEFPGCQGCTQPKDMEYINDQQ